MHLILVPVAQTKALNGPSLKHKEAPREKKGKKKMQLPLGSEGLIEDKIWGKLNGQTGGQRHRFNRGSDVGVPWSDKVSAGAGRAVSRAISAFRLWEKVFKQQLTYTKNPRIPSSLNILPMALNTPLPRKEKSCECAELSHLCPVHRQPPAMAVPPQPSFQQEAACSAFSPHTRQV